MKALSVFSGGLDSMLATQLIRAQDIEVQAIFFETPFFSPHKAAKSADTIGVPFKVVDITKKHLEIVKNPKHGHGGNMNPCIDCHAVMFRTAVKMLEQENAKFIITGEVLGQRPMSQNRKALEIIEKEIGMEGIVLRPLSAKCLPVTTPEKQGWVDREKLMGLSGRSRKPQIKLADKFNIKEYPSPAGGCLLTDKIFSQRLRDLFAPGNKLEIREIELLKIGRHFRTSPDSKIIVGRNKAENQTIKSLSTEHDLLLNCGPIPGPTALVTGTVTPEVEKIAAIITASYSDADNSISTEINLKRGDEEKKTAVKGLGKTELKQYMV
ncbi:tRNA 4-thiouridine(8) synthase ThiI [Thermodesulfobacteriota bacterium]